MKPIYVQRLKKLAKHLRNGKLQHRKFYFGGWNVNRDHEQIVVNGCSFAGCAIGECPAVFASWHWKDGRPRHKGGLLGGPRGDAQTFFGLSQDETNHLFMPEEQEPEKFGGEILYGSATRKQVAKGIEEFLKRKEKQ